MTKSHDQYNELQNRINQLEEELLFYHSIMNHLPGHVYWLDKENRYLGCNAEHAKNIGLSNRLDIVGKTNHDMPWKENAELINATNNEVMMTDEPISIKELWNENGRCATYLSKKVPLKNQKGELLGILGISIDITEIEELQKLLIKAKEAAEAASRAKTAFIANISHDTRTPLTGVIGLSIALENPAIPEAERIEYARMIHEGGEKLLEFSESVLDDVALDTISDDAIVCESFDVRKVIKDVITLELPTVKVNHLNILMNVDENIPPYLMGDKLKLHRILLNLTGNAIKFTKEGEVEIKARLLSKTNDEATIEFSVKDTGIGIASEHQDKVFEKFFKVTPSFKGLYKGYGLGLHIVNKFVSLMGGEIRLESTLGVGTCISFVLTMKVGEKPLMDEMSTSVHWAIDQQSDLPIEKNPSVSIVTNISEETEMNKAQVLLVEDNIAAMTVLKAMMQQFDVQISTAADAEKAFELVQSQRFQLVITDLGLPAKQGDDLSRMIRDFEKTHQRPRMKIVGLTGHVVDEIATQCLEAGMDEVYRKPMMAPTLAKLVEPLIKQQQEKPILPEGSKKSGGLGVDLPDTEEGLFQIDQYPLFDINVGVAVLGSADVVKEILKTLKVDAIDDDLALIKEAHAVCDWDTVQKLAHKMKGGSDFGTVRMHYALLYMERYLKAGHTTCSEALYEQMLKTIDETMDFLENRLS